MKYRRLRHDELRTLEKDFIDFLASQSITADEWKKMDKMKRYGMIDIFSDMVFDNVLEKVSLLERIEPDKVHLFYFSDEKITLRGFKWKGDNQPFDFTKIMGSTSWPDYLGAYHGDLHVFKAEKKYSKPKKEEIFYLLEQGCKISENLPLFQTLQKLSRKPV